MTQMPQNSYISGDSVSQRSKSKSKKKAMAQGKLTFGQPQVYTGTNTQYSQSRSNSPLLRQGGPSNDNSASQVNEGEATPESLTQKQLVEEVKDLTARNAEVLMKFKEFQKETASVSLGRPNESSEAIQMAPIAISKVNESKRDVESKKDSIH